MLRSRRLQLKRLLATVMLAGMGGSAVAAEPVEIQLVSARSGQITTLSADEAEQLFLGRRTTLSNGTPVKLIDLPAGLARDRLYLLLTGKNPIQTRAYWSRQVFTGRALPPREAASLQQARDWLADTPDAIGYLPAGIADNRLQVLLRLP